VALSLTRIIYLATPACAIAPLEDLLSLQESQHIEVIAVVSRHAQLIGRGKRKQLQDPPVAEFAKKQQIPVLQPESAKDPAFLAQLRALAPDLMITAAYGQILNEEFLAIPKRGTINIHPSLLPQYRGTTPVQTALLHGDQVSGVTILFTVKQLDAGAIISQKIFPIAADETAGELQDRLFRSCRPLLRDALQKLADHDFSGTEQNPALVSQCRRIHKEFGQIDWSKNSDALVNAYRAYHPWPGSFTFYENIRIVVEGLSLFVGEPQRNAAMQVGSFYLEPSSQQLVVKTADSWIKIARLQREGGVMSSAAQFWHGLKSPVDPCFSLVR
jgi:methionyl-tRNA formyltransferase